MLHSYIWGGELRNSIDRKLPRQGDAAPHWNMHKIPDSVTGNYVKQLFIWFLVPEQRKA